MGRLSYLLGRLNKLDYRKMWATAGILRRESGRSRLWLLTDMARCGLKYNAGYMDYRIARMDCLNQAQRQTVITRGINNGIVRRMNDKAFWHHFDDKAEFNTQFAKWVDRKWIRADEHLTQEALEAFLKDQAAVFVKPIEGSSGVGIHKVEKDGWKDTGAFYRLVMSYGPGIIEECVVQHPRMAQLNPGSVNTVRIATLMGDKAEGIVYAFLRIGNGQVMDNVDAGGMAARVDLESGRLLTVAADKQGRVFEKHPLTGTRIPGFEVPFFQEAKQMCLEAMKVVPQLRYVAWDVAITRKGPRLIEGNSFPSHAVPQFAAHYPDGIGILPEFHRFLTL